MKGPRLLPAPQLVVGSRKTPWQARLEAPDDKLLLLLLLWLLQVPVVSLCCVWWVGKRMRTVWAAKIDTPLLCLLGGWVVGLGEVLCGPLIYRQSK